MDTRLNEEESMIRTTARRFLEAECPTKLVRAMEQDELGYCPKLWQKAAELGWPGLALPETYGGSGMPLVYLGLVMEEIGRTLAPLPLHSTVVAALAIARDGDKTLQGSILPRVASGDLILTWAFQEQDPRISPDAVTCAAVADGDDFVIDGTKLFVDNFAASEYCLVVCRTAQATEDHAGLSIFLVETKSAGISIAPLITLAKDRQSEVQFENVRVPKANLVGPLNHGAPLAETMLEQGAILLCAQMLGAARKDAEIAVEWTKTRKVFGRPLGAFQSIQHMCADMLIWIDGGELLTYEALWRMDQGLPARVEVSQAKAFCSEKCVEVVRNCQVLHGGIGFMLEFDLHLWYRRVWSWATRLGTMHEHRAKVAAALLDKPGDVRLGDPFPIAAAI